MKLFNKIFGRSPYKFQIPTGPLKGEETFLKFPLEDVFQLTHDSKIFRFSLPSPELCLGLPIGQHLVLRAQLEMPKSNVEKT